MARNKKIEVLKETSKLTDEQTWLKHPNVITTMAAKMDTIHLRILITIIEKLQEPIEKSINNKQLSLFQTNTDNVELVINMKDLGVTPDYYKKARQALEELGSLTIKLDTIDPNTNKSAWYITGLIRPYVPKKYERQFTVKLDNEVAKALILVDKRVGYTKYIKEVAIGSNNKYAIRFYWLISSWINKGGFRIKYKDLREQLGIDKEYSKWNDFRNKVLTRSKNILKEIGNCWFEFSILNWDDEKKEPVSLTFKVIDRKYTISQEELLISQTKLIEEMLKLRLQLSDKEISVITDKLNDTNVMSIKMKLVEMLSNYKIKHKKPYIMKTLEAYLEND